MDAGGGRGLRCSGMCPHPGPQKSGDHLLPRDRGRRPTAVGPRPPWGGKGWIPRVRAQAKGPGPPSALARLQVALNGSFIVKVAPWPDWLDTSIVPLCASTIWRQRKSPIPAPLEPLVL